MTIDDAIKHAKEKAQKHRQTEKKYREIHRSENDESLFKEQLEDCIGCAEEHEQLAGWLEELKEYKENKHRSLRYMYEKGYNKGIDDLTEKISIYGTYDYYGNVIDVLEIAEKLKKECTE